MRVLIVDDERTAIKDITKILEKIEPDADVTACDNAGEALALCRSNDFDVVLLDIRMPDMDGLTLASEIKAIRPVINIIITTAHPEYALESYKLYVSDYLLKPVIKEQLRKSLDNLRNPVNTTQKGLYVKCFGDFDVYYDGEPVSFGRAKTKELFAYLIDRKGARCTNAQVRAALWGDQVSNDNRQRHYFAQITYELRQKLDLLGLSDIFIHSRDSYAIVPDRIPCDYYKALRQDSTGLKHYEGDIWHSMSGHR